MDGPQFDALARRMASATSRRRLVKGIAGGLTALIAGGVATRQASARTITICHATGNPGAPYQSLTIEQAEFNLHARHGDYLRVECCADDDCSNQYGACGSGVCQNGYCSQLPVPAGTSCGDGSFCTGESACDGAFNCVQGAAVVCPASDNPCVMSVCDESARGCVDAWLADGESCGGDLCQPSICQSGVCFSPPQGCQGSENPCYDNVCNPANGQCEPQLRLNQPCVAGNQQPGSCNSDGVCIATATCSDGIKNGSETDVDCGGGTCPSCATGKMCGIHADCASNLCISGVCSACLPGQTNCGGTCVDLTNDPSNCGACGSVCPGYMKPYTNVSCQQSTCTFTCQGEHYDVDGDPTNGCEFADSPLNHHTQQQALSLGSISCDDETILTFGGSIPSDGRVHANPAVTGFDIVTGSAPDWHKVRATGGLCQNDILATLTVTGASVPTCYQLQVVTDKHTYSASTNADGFAVIRQTIDQYSDDTDVYIGVSKICGASSKSAAEYTLSIHL